MLRTWRCYRTLLEAFEREHRLWTCFFITLTGRRWTEALQSGAETSRDCKYWLNTVQDSNELQYPHQQYGAKTG